VQHARQAEHRQPNPADQRQEELPGEAAKSRPPAQAQQVVQEWQCRLDGINQLVINPKDECHRPTRNAGDDVGGSHQKSAQEDAQGVLEGAVRNRFLHWLPIFVKILPPGLPGGEALIVKPNGTDAKPDGFNPHIVQGKALTWNSLQVYS